MADKYDLTVATSGVVDPGVVEHLIPHAEDIRAGRVIVAVDVHAGTAYYTGRGEVLVEILENGTPVTPSLDLVRDAVDHLPSDAYFTETPIPAGAAVARGRVVLDLPAVLGTALTVRIRSTADAGTVSSLDVRALLID